MRKMTNINYIDMQKFIDMGYLQEANRQFFHPLGLALEATYQKDGTFVLLHIWDYRDDKEGMTFIALDSKEIQERADNVEKLRKKHAKIRKEKYGWEIQPIGHTFRKK